MISPIFLIYFGRCCLFHTPDLGNEVLPDGQDFTAAEITSLISSETSSPTSKSGSILMASRRRSGYFHLLPRHLQQFCRLRQISRSPLSMLTMMSKLSALPEPLCQHMLEIHLPGYASWFPGRCS